MKLLIIIPRQPRTTGNHVSASRFAASLQTRGWRVQVLSVAEDDGKSISQALQSSPDVVLLLHAYRTGKPWLLSQPPDEIPFAVLMTGTDLNRDLEIPERAAVIDQTLARAATMIVQNRITFSELLESRRPWRPKVRLLPPGIDLGTGRYGLRAELRLQTDDLLLLLPGSIRPVKRNLELLQMAGGLLNHNDCLHLAFCGPTLDSEYAAQFLAALKSQARANYLGEIPCAVMPDVLLQADLVLNNSTSEGVPNALVEAASLGRPILARNIPGNCSVVRPGVNGLLFNNSQDFAQQLLSFTSDPNVRSSLSHPDPQSFSAEVEGERLEEILLEISPSRPG